MKKHIKYIIANEEFEIYSLEVYQNENEICIYDDFNLVNYSVWLLTLYKANPDTIQSFIGDMEFYRIFKKSLWKLMRKFPHEERYEICDNNIESQFKNLEKYGLKLTIED